MDFVGQSCCDLGLVGAGGVGMEGATIEYWDLYVAEVIGGPFSLNEELRVGIWAVPVGGIHPIEIAKDVYCLIPVFSLTGCEGNLVDRLENFVLEYFLYHNYIEIFNRWAEVHALELYTDVKGVKG